MKKLIKSLVAVKLRNSIRRAHLRLLQFVLDTIGSLKSVEKAPLLSYPEAVKYFVSGRPEDPRIAKGALLQRKAPGGILVVWIFLDEAGTPLVDDRGKAYGRKLIVEQMDEELADCFGGNEILVFE